MSAVVAEISIPAALQRHHFEVAPFHAIGATNLFCLAKYTQGFDPAFPRPRQRGIDSLRRFLLPPNIPTWNHALLFKSLIEFAHEFEHSLGIEFLGRFFGDLTPGTSGFRRRIL